MASGPREYQDRMVARLPLDEAVARHPAGNQLKRPQPSFLIVFPGSDGTVLLKLTETEDGRLHADYDPARCTEAAIAFLDQMLQWSGQRPLRWKDDVEAAATGQQQ